MKKFCVLIVDDEPILVMALKAQLQNHFRGEIDVQTANGVEEALSILHENKHETIPLVISDYLMPGTKGDELILQLDKLYPDMLCILLTGQIDLKAIGNIINNAKLFRYIAKPWNETDLILTVREALNTFKLTSTVKIQNKQIVDYAFSNAHHVRGPLARILGLVSLIKHEPDIIHTDRVIDKLEASALELDGVVRQITETLEEQNDAKHP